MQLYPKTNGRILEEGDRMYLNALDNQVIPYSDMISLNYLPNNVPLDAKFTVFSNQTVHRLQVDKASRNSNTDNWCLSN